MKNRTERDKIIYELWDKGMSFDALSTVLFPSFLSLKRVRNVVYAGPYKLDALGGKHHNFKGYYIELYSLFRMKFLEFQDVNTAIKWVYENQPDGRLSAQRIRSIINEQLKLQKHV